MSQAPERVITIAIEFAKNVNEIHPLRLAEINEIFASKDASITARQSTSDSIDTGFLFLIQCVRFRLKGILNKSTDFQVAKENFREVEFLFELVQHFGRTFVLAEDFDIKRFFDLADAIIEFNSLIDDYRLFMSKLDKYEVEKGGVDWFTLFFRYELAMRNLVKDPEGAFKELQYTANKSWPKSFYNVGYCYSIGRGITQDTAKAINFYQLAWAATKNDVSAFNMAVNMCELDDQLNAMRIFEMIADSDTQIDFIRLESIKHCYHYFHNRALNNLRGEDMLKANRFEALAKKHSLEIEYD